MGRRMRRWWCGGVSYNLRESFISTCCTGFSPRKIHHSMGGPLLLHSDTTRSGSDEMARRIQSKRRFFVRAGSACSSKIWGYQECKNFNKSYSTGSIPSPSFIMGDDESSILNKYQLVTFLLERLRFSRNLESICHRLTECTASFGNRHPFCSIHVTILSFSQALAFLIEVICSYRLQKVSCEKPEAIQGHRRHRAYWEAAQKPTNHAMLWLSLTLPILDMPLYSSSGHDIWNTFNKVRIFHTYIGTYWLLVGTCNPPNPKTSKQWTWNIDISKAPSWNRTNNITYTSSNCGRFAKHNYLLPANFVRALPSLLPARSTAMKRCIRASSDVYYHCREHKLKITG